MKNVFALLVVFILFGNKTPLPPKTASLQDAVNQKLIELDVHGNTNSPNYSQPIQLTVKNLINSPFMLKIPN
mgnify:CR=1 FL=1|tara:strand:+ start:420 stop:635 length:216 start_codon:yes stop_codon:yes gene_type:complete